MRVRYFLIQICQGDSDSLLYYDLLDSQLAIMVTTPFLGYRISYFIHYIQVGELFRRPVELLLSYSVAQEPCLCCYMPEHRSGQGE
jgi:hypothetical protein